MKRHYKMIVRVIDKGTRYSHRWTRLANEKLFKGRQVTAEKSRAFLSLIYGHPREPAICIIVLTTESY